ncbi:hypothetical protein L9F63_019078, partial [Diploptera punctata]
DIKQFSENGLFKLRTIKLYVYGLYPNWNLWNTRKTIWIHNCDTNEDHLDLQFTCYSHLHSNIIHFNRIIEIR